MRIFKKEDTTGNRKYHKNCWKKKQQEYEYMITHFQKKVQLLIEERNRQNVCFEIFNKYGTYLNYEPTPKNVNIQLNEKPINNGIIEFK